MQLARLRISAAIFYMGFLGILGWVVLTLPSTGTAFGPDTVSRPDWPAVGMFSVVIVATRTVARTELS